MNSAAARVPLLAAAMLAMAWGIWMGLLRLGWVLPLPWPDQLILHGPLMIGGFLGTVIGLERAIGTAKPWAYAGPACTAAGAVALVFGPPGPLGPFLITAGSVVLVTVFVALVAEHRTLFLAVMLGAAIAWLAGNAWWLLGAAIYRLVFWWVAFAVLTIAGERLELNRLRSPTRRARRLFVFAVTIVLAALVAAPWQPTASARAFGVGLLALAGWLMHYDIARRTIRQKGVTRYIAACLLAGYVWLAVAGGLLIATAAAAPGTTYDAVLHAVFVGFVVSMIFGHAPIVLPAVIGRPFPFTPALYAALVVLHASVALRLLGDLVEDLGRLRAWGGLTNVLALLLFAATAIVRPAARRPSAHSALQ